MLKSRKWNFCFQIENEKSMCGTNYANRRTVRASKEDGGEKYRSSPGLVELISSSEPICGGRPPRADLIVPMTT